MVRSVAIITVTVSLLLGSAQVYSDSTLQFPEPADEALVIEDSFTTRGVTCSQVLPCPGEKRHHIGQPCPISGHRHLIGEHCPDAGHHMKGQRLVAEQQPHVGGMPSSLAERGFAFRLGAEEKRPCPLKARQEPGPMVMVLPGRESHVVVVLPGQDGQMMVAVPGPEGQLMSVSPNQMGVMPGQMVLMADSTGATPGQMMMVVQGQNDGQMMVVPRQDGGPPPRGGFFGGVFAPRQYQPEQPQAGYVQGGYPGTVSYANGQGSYGGYPVPGQERIVYVPYAAPPPITVERLAKALPIPIMPPQKMLRRILGDANMYEYPEMPLHLYTTRGPRDFMAPAPPCIGE